MPFTSFAALMLMANGPVVVVTPPTDAEFEIGYEQLATGDNQAAIEEIESGKVLAEDDPARLINHAVALARAGEYDAARDKLEFTARYAERLELETATGDWVDSRVLARRGLALLDEGKFERYVALAQR